MSKKEFVNRRGKKLTIDENEHETQIINAPSKAQKKSEMSSSSTRTHRSVNIDSVKFSKHSIKNVAIVLAVVVGIPLLGGEFLTWQYNHDADALSQSAQKTGSEKVLPLQKQGKFRQAVDESLGTLSLRKDAACRGGLSDNAANLYFRARSALERCNDEKQKVASLTLALTTLRNADDYMKKVDAVLKAPLTPSSSTYAVIPDQIKSWEEATKKLKEVKPTKEFAVFHLALQETTAGITAAWSDLNTANNNQDSAAFNEAEKRLNAGYASMRGFAGELNTQLQKIQGTIDTSYSAIIRKQ